MHAGAASLPEDRDAALSPPPLQPRRRSRADADDAAAPAAAPAAKRGAAAVAAASSWPPPPPVLDAAAAAELRSKSAVLLAEALQDPTPLYGALSTRHSCLDSRLTQRARALCTDFGCAVEAAVFDACGGSAACRDYTARVRRLVASLRRNAELRAEVLSGALSPAALADAPTEALATAAQRDALRAAQDAATRRATAGDGHDGALPTKEHPCPLCSSTEVLFVRVGGARDIGKSETWGSKDAEAFSLRLTCTACKVRAQRRWLAVRSFASGHSFTYTSGHVSTAVPLHHGEDSALTECQRVHTLASQHEWKLAHQ
jgi:hypothetical protein